MNRACTALDQLKEANVTYWFDFLRRRYYWVLCLSAEVRGYGVHSWVVIGTMLSVSLYLVQRVMMASKDAVCRCTRPADVISQHAHTLLDRERRACAPSNLSSILHLLPTQWTSIASRLSHKLSGETSPKSALHDISCLKQYLCRQIRTQHPFRSSPPAESISPA